MPGFSTNAIHVGQEPEPTTGAVVPPIFMTSTYAQEWPAKDKGYDYSRAGNPTYTNFEKQIASLEGGKHGVVFASGLSVISSLLCGLPQGTTVAALSSAYGGTYRLLNRVFSNHGIKLSLALFGDWQALEKIFAEDKPHYFFFETPTNPLLEVIDIAEICALCKKYDVLSVCDNTFSSPYLQNPLALGADVVMHSCTKYIGGHSDIVSGCLVTDNDEIAQLARFNRMSVGLNPSPMDVWLLSRSLKTLAVRMDRHCLNAMRIAEYLESHPLVSKVIYPGLKSHPQYEVAAKQRVSQSRGFSGMVSVYLKLSLEQTKHMLANCKVFTLAESLGGVESLIEHPASMTHASIPAAERAKIGLGDGLIRLSCGLEDSDDLIQDLDEAIQYAANIQA